MRSTMRILIIAAVLMTLVGSVSAAPSYPAEVLEWLKIAKVGPFQETEIDYDSVYQEAKKEGKLVVYSGSSRMPAVALEFEKLYPELTSKLKPWELLKQLRSSKEKLWRACTEWMYSKRHRRGDRKLCYTIETTCLHGRLRISGTCLPLIK